MLRARTQNSTGGTTEALLIQPYPSMNANVNMELLPMELLARPLMNAKMVTYIHTSMMSASHSEENLLLTVLPKKIPSALRLARTTT